ncbi:hypothetical protein [Burkholderia perseverans]|uniref:hypothetical protein n=1 Tax=Burkholderia perseverans TaxID=2615214 RepID=UPI001FED3929|nr:hypothetical protein [Burkholderia perseverans]
MSDVVSAWSFLELESQFSGPETGESTLWREITTVGAEIDAEQQAGHHGGRHSCASRRMGHGANNAAQTKRRPAGLMPFS